MTMEIKDNNEFKKIIEENKIVFIDFYADWCGPCKMYSPIFNAVSEERKDIKMISINVDELTDLATEYDVSSIPTTLIVKDKKEIGRFLGFIYKEDLIKLVDQAVGNKKLEI